MVAVSWKSSTVLVFLAGGPMMAMDSVDLADSVDDLADSVDPSDLVVGCACDALHGVQRAVLVFLAGGSMMAMDSVDLADSVDLSDLADSVDPPDLADDCVVDCACDVLIFAMASSASLAALAYPAFSLDSMQGVASTAYYYAVQKIREVRWVHGVREVRPVHGVREVHGVHCHHGPPGQEDQDG